MEKVGPPPESLDKKYIPALCDEMTQIAWERTKADLNENEENVTKGLDALRSYIKKKNRPPLEDDYLLSFLRVAKFDVHKAKDRLKRYYETRYKIADFLDEFLDLDKIEILIDGCMIGIMPFKDEEGRIMLYTRGQNWSPEKVDFQYLAVSFVGILLFISTMSVAAVNGLRYICDPTPQHYSYYYTFFQGFKDHYTITQAIPARMKKMDSINDNQLCRCLYSLLKPFLPTKLTQRANLHGDDWESFHRHASPDILNEEFGGKLGPLNNDFFKKELFEYLTRLKASNEVYKRQN